MRHGLSSCTAQTRFYFTIMSQRTYNAYLRYEAIRREESTSSAVNAEVLTRPRAELIIAAAAPAAPPAPPAATAVKIPARGRTAAMVAAERHAEAERAFVRANASMERAELRHQSTVVEAREEQQTRERERVVSEQGAARRRQAEDAAEASRQMSLDNLISISKGPVSASINEFRR